MPLPPFVPRDLLREQVPEELNTGPDHTAVTVRTVAGNTYRRHIHLAGHDGGEPFVVAEGTTPRWIPPPDDLADSDTKRYLDSLAGQLSLLRDGRLWAVAPTPGARPRMVAELAAGPIVAYEWNPRSEMVACLVAAHSSPEHARYDGGQLLATVQRRADQVSDGRGYHGSVRHQLVLVWPRSAHAVDHADVTSHLRGDGDPAPGNREVEMFAWSPEGHELALTMNLREDADTRPGTDIYLFGIRDLHDYDPLTHARLSPLPPWRLTREPQSINSLTFYDPYTILYTAPPPGRPDHARRVLHLLSTNSRRTTVIPTAVNVGATPLNGVDLHVGSPPIVLPRQAVEGVDPEADMAAPRIYVLGTTAAEPGRGVTSAAMCGLGWASVHAENTGVRALGPWVPRPIIDVAASTDEAIRRLAVVPGPVRRTKGGLRADDGLVVVATSATHPGRVLRWGPEPRPLLPLPSPLDGRAQPRVSTAWIPRRRRSGPPMQATVFQPPEGTVDGPTPVVLGCKGGHNTVITDNSYVLEGPLLASAGLTVVMFNGAGSDVDDNATDLHGRWGTIEVDDALDARDWALAGGGGELDIDPAWLGLLGMSAGGAIAGQMLARDPQAYRVACLARPILDPKDWYLSADQSRYLPTVLGPYEAAMHGPATLRERLPEIVDSLPPLILVQGTEDKRTPLSQTEPVFNGLRLLGKPDGPARRTPHELVTVPGASHLETALGPPLRRVAYLESVVLAMDNYLTRARLGLPPRTWAEFRAAQGRPVAPAPAWSKTRMTQNPLTPPAPQYAQGGGPAARKGSRQTWA